MKSNLRMAVRVLNLMVLVIFAGNVLAQNSDSITTPSIVAAPEVKVEIKEEQPWYKKLSLRGYTQIRYNGLYTNPDLKCDQCDKSWGGIEELFVRRARIVISGDVHERVSIYIQPDFASSPASGLLNFAQLRDLYADIYFDKKKTFRVRPGLSKIPFGFENLQSSQNRLPLDRNDGLNSAVANERDLGVFFYYAPTKVRDRFKKLQNSRLKGSGDYGMIGLGFYNGQTLNKPDENDNFHVAARFTYPFELKNGQIIEASLQGYTGQYVLTSVSSDLNPDEQYLDQRVAASFVVYPQPFGFQSEVNFGRGPQFVPSLGVIDTKELNGGYVMTMYKYESGNMFFFPFARYHWYDGGKKQELDARRYKVSEWEFGMEWQPIPNVELVAMYVFSDRRFEDFKKSDNHQTGSLLRVQLQINY